MLWASTLQSTSFTWPSGDFDRTEPPNLREATAACAGLDELAKIASNVAGRFGLPDDVLRGLALPPDFFTNMRLSDEALAGLRLLHEPVIEFPTGLITIPSARSVVDSLEARITELEREHEKDSEQLACLRAANKELRIRLMLRDMGDTQDDTDTYFPITGN